MAVALQPVMPPLARDDDGVIRVAGTRVTLDTVVEAFESGASAEEITGQYPSVALPDVYATIAYYLQHRAELEPYFEARREAHDQVRREAQAASGLAGVRERLLARRPG